MSGLGLLAQRAADYAQKGRHDEAVKCWEQAHRLAPADPRVSMALGAALLSAKRETDASHWLAAETAHHPQHVGLLIVHAQCLLQLRDRKLAIGALFRALALEPDNVEVQGLLAHALYWERQPAAALPFSQFAVSALQSDLNVTTYLCILIDLGFPDAAVKFMDDLLEAGIGDRPTMKLFRAGVLQAAGRDDESISDVREAIEAMPDNGVARHQLAASLLLRGELTAEAWELYEGRSGLLSMPHWPEPELCWSGQDLAGKTILVHAEQGLGDTLQFVRYVPMLAASGAKVVLVVQAALQRLLEGTPGAFQVLAAGSPLPRFDYYCPLLSLPGRFGTTLETIPAVVPYRSISSGSLERADLRVGLVWYGRPTFVEDRKRSIDPALLAPLAAVAGVEFHNLQFGAETMPLPGMKDRIEGVRDFADTAELIGELDLVITVDTAVAHLAATMGKPVWILARHQGCWRWLLEREDSPWYPSVRLFRQRRGETWEPAFARVCTALAQLVAARNAAMELAA